MDLDQDARRILDLAADANAPAAADKARIEKKLAAALGAGVLATTGTAATASVASATQTASGASSGSSLASSAALKWWLGTTVIAASITGYIAFSPAKPAPAKAPPTPAPMVVAPPVPPPAPSEPAVAHAPEPEPAPTTARSHSPRKQAAPTLDRELELLHRAQTAWRAREASTALTLLDEHRTRFPRSQLRLERDGLRVLTLCELGRQAEASALAKKLIERAPRSPLRRTIEESCALK